MIALIDADILIYRTGFASQKTFYIFKYVNGTEVTVPASSILLVKKWLKENNLSKDDGTLYKTLSILAPELACHTMDKTLNMWVAASGVSRYQCFLTSADRSNYRFQIAKTKPYKGNRVAAKPAHYDLLREYLMKTYPTTMVYDEEADDRLGIISQNQCKDACVIVSIDKDLNQLPGDHYNPVTLERYIVTDPGVLTLSSDKRKLSGGGVKWFYAQMLLGDSADNIPGISGLGPVSVYHALVDINTEIEMLKITYNLYKSNLNAELLQARFLEVADLLWIRRTRGESKSSFLKPYVEKL